MPSKSSPPKRSEILMTTVVDSELIALQERWSPGWKITRARRSDDPPGRRTGSYCAARMLDSAGVRRFLMSRSREALEDALEANAAAVDNKPHGDLDPPLFP